MIDTRETAGATGDPPVRGYPATVFPFCGRRGGRERESSRLNPDGNAVRLLSWLLDKLIGPDGTAIPRIPARRSMILRLTSAADTPSSLCACVCVCICVCVRATVIDRIDLNGYPLRPVAPTTEIFPSLLIDPRAISCEQRSPSRDRSRRSWNRERQIPSFGLWSTVGSRRSVSITRRAACRFFDCVRARRVFSYTRDFHVLHARPTCSGMCSSNFEFQFLVFSNLGPAVRVLFTWHSCVRLLVAWCFSFFVEISDLT